MLLQTKMTNTMTKAQRTFNKLAEVSTPTAIAGVAGTGLLGYGGYKAYQNSQTSLAAAKKASKLKGAGKVGTAVAGLAGLGVLGYKAARNHAPKFFTRKLYKAYDVAGDRAAAKRTSLTFNEILGTKVNSRVHKPPLSGDEVSEVLHSFTKSNRNYFPKATIGNKIETRADFNMNGYRNMHHTYGNMKRNTAIENLRTGDLKRGNVFSKSKTLRENYNQFKQSKAKIPSAYRSLLKELHTTEIDRLRQLSTQS